jgi:hypothetical protein
VLGSYRPSKRTAPRWTNAVLTDTEIVTSGSSPDTRYRILVSAVEHAINEADPIGLLDIGAPSDEYSPEIGTILPRPAGVQGVSGVTNVLHEEFVRWFDQGIAGPSEAYEAPARPIWAALLEYRDVVG